jgi:hypothetical protein
MTIDELLERAAAQAGRNITDTEWHEYLPDRRQPPQTLITAAAK